MKVSEQVYQEWIGNMQYITDIQKKRDERIHSILKGTPSIEKAV